MKPNFGKCGICGSDRRIVDEVRRGVVLECDCDFTETFARINVSEETSFSKDDGE